MCSLTYSRLPLTWRSPRPIPFGKTLDKPYMRSKQQKKKVGVTRPRRVKRPGVELTGIGNAPGISTCRDRELCPPDWSMLLSNFPSRCHPLGLAAVGQHLECTILGLHWLEFLSISCEGGVINVVIAMGKQQFVQCNGDEL
jgi:hypothetical protein